MAQIVKELRVDVSQPNVFQAIVAKQHDSNSRFLKITLVDFGVKVEVPNTAKVTINANRPDGASESFKGEANNDGTITVPLAQWMLDIEGEVKCDVSVTNTEDNKRLTSTDFWLEVQKAANPNASIPLDPDGEILIIKPVTEINGNSKDTDYPSAKAVYDYGQNIVTDTQITATATGNAITIESANAPLQNLKLFGKTTQDGTPTPDNPIELKSVGDSGSLEVGVYGKNLLPYPFPNSSGTSYTSNGLTFTVDEDGIITINGTSTAQSTYYIARWLGTVKYDRYVCFMTPDAINLTVYKANNWWGVGNNNCVKVSAGEGLVEIYLQFASGKTFNNAKAKVMITLEPNYDYEPCNKQNLTIPYTLRSVGDIKDEVDFTRGVKIPRVKKIVLDGSQTIYMGENKQFYLWLDITGTWSTPCAISTHFKYSVEYTYLTIQAGYMAIDATGKLYFTLDFSTVAECKAWLTENPITIYAYCKTPIETPLTETELNAYRQLMTNKGTTTILNSGGADMQVDYYVNKPNAQSIGNLHTQINKDYFKLQQAIISTGGSTL